jgi:hypothetical protein
MARITYTKRIETYTFNPPRSISLSEYLTLKKQIENQPNKPLIDEESVHKSHEKLQLLIGFGVILLAVGLIGLFAVDTPTWWGGLLTIISIFGILHPSINSGNLESSRNRVAVEDTRIAYFRHLKRLIETSKDYSDFQLNYSKQFNY